MLSKEDVKALELYLDIGLPDIGKYKDEGNYVRLSNGILMEKEFIQKLEKGSLIYYQISDILDDWGYKILRQF